MQMARVGHIGDQMSNQRDYDRLATIAVNLAAVPPLRRSHQAHNAIVPWNLIVDLRSELDGVGIDWRRAKAQADADRGPIIR